MAATARGVLSTSGATTWEVTVSGEWSWFTQVAVGLSRMPLRVFDSWILGRSAISATTQSRPH